MKNNILCPACEAPIVNENFKRPHFEFLGSIKVTDKTWDLAQWQALHKVEWMQLLRSNV